MSAQSVRNRPGCSRSVGYAVAGHRPAPDERRATAGHNPERLCLMKARGRNTSLRCAACHMRQWQVCECLSPVLPGHVGFNRVWLSRRPTRGMRRQGGIVYSNAVTTVSPTYAREALDGGAAGWLRSTLARPEVRAKFEVRATRALSLLASRVAAAWPCWRPAPANPATRTG